MIKNSYFYINIITVTSIANTEETVAVIAPRLDAGCAPVLLVAVSDHTDKTTLRRQSALAIDRFVTTSARLRKLCDRLVCFSKNMT
jgi:hypothetical protein